MVGVVEINGDIIGEGEERLWEMLGDIGRRLGMLGNVGTCREMLGDVWRFWEMLGDVGRC